MRWGWLPLLAIAWTAGGCSTLGDALDVVNPFGKSAPKIKPAELPVFQPAAELMRSWQATIGSAGEYVFTPAAVGHSVYLAARDGVLARLDDGREVWRVSAGQVLSGGVGASDRLVVVGTPKGEVLAFHAADGRPAWQARASSEVLAAPALQGDLVVVRSGDARVFAFDATDGKQRWVYQRTTPALALRSNGGVVLTEKTVFAGFPGGKLVALARANGMSSWEVAVALPHGATELERLVDVASDPVVEGNVVCAAAYQGRVACFDADDGRLRWAREISSIAGLDIGNHALFVTDEKGVLQAFDRNSGASLWQQDKLFMRGVGRPLALGSRLAVADAQGYVHLLSAEDGAFVARLATDGSAIAAAPRRLPDGADSFVVQTKNGSVYGLALR